MSNYSSFEVKENGILERVEALCRHLTSGGSFGDSTPVTLSDVEMYIDDSYYWLIGELVKNGYGTAVTDANVKKVLQQIQSLDAVAQVEFSMPVSDTGEPNDRYKSMAARRDRMVTDYLRSDALEQMGAVRTRNKSDYFNATGRSIDRKKDVYQNTDVPQARFPRGFGQRQNTPNRSGVNTPSGGADPDL